MRLLILILITTCGCARGPLQVIRKDNQDLTIIRRGVTPVSICIEPDAKIQSDDNRKCYELATVIEFK